MYDNNDEEEDDDDEELANPETLRRESAERTHGIEGRAFYDDLAKQEDERHRAMRADFAHRSLMLDELRQKLRHHETELHALDTKISIEENRIAYETKKAYQQGGQGSPDIVVPPIPILTKDIDPSEEESGDFSMERAAAHLKQLQIEKAALEKIRQEQLFAIHEEERLLSQIEHTISRM